MTEARRRLAWWMIGLGVLSLVLLLSITTAAWGLFVLSTVIAGVIVRNTRRETAGDD